MTSERTIIRGAEVFDGEQRLGARDVIVEGGRIAEVCEPRDDDFYATAREEAMGRVLEVSRAGADTVIDARGKLLSPGFIDLHCHLRDPGQTWKEDIFSGSAAAAAGGFTTVVCMPNTDPPIDRGAVAEYVIDRGMRCGLCRVLPAGCLSAARDGEELSDLASLYAAGVRIFSDDGSDTAGADTFLHALEFLSMLPDARALIHAEVPELAAGVMHEGEVCARLGHGGIHHLSEDIGAARALLCSLSAGQPLQITHISSASTLDLVRYAKLRAQHDGCPDLISADATYNHLLLTEEAVAQHGSLAKINPPLRSEADRQALLSALVDGTLDALVTDHAPHTLDEKAQEMQYAPFGIAGFELAFGLLNAGLVGRDTPAGVITLERVLGLLTSGPARLLAGARPGVGRAVPALGEGPLTDFHPRRIETSPGRVAAGLAADLALIDLEAEWEIDPEQLLSRGRNMPYAGWQAKGRVLLTMCGGRITHRADGFAVQPAQAEHGP